MAGNYQADSAANAWEGWCDHLLKGSTKAGIFGHNKQPYCIKPELQISQTFLDDAEKVMSQGIETSKIYKLQLDGSNYFILQADDNHLIAKSGQKGLSVAKSGSCYLVGAYDQSIQPGTNSNAVMGTRDLLVDSETQTEQCQHQQQYQKK